MFFGGRSVYALSMFSAPTSITYTSVVNEAVISAYESKKGNT